MSSSRQPGIPLLTALAVLLAGKCDDPACAGCNPTPAAQATDSAGAAPQADQQTRPAPDASLAKADSADQAAQETLVASGGISQSACRAVGLTDSDAGEIAQFKGAAAALITCLEDLRDSIPAGETDRMTAEGQIGAVAKACAWAVSRLPKQAA